MNWSGDTPGLPGITATRYPFPVVENVLIDPPMRAVAIDLERRTADDAAVLPRDEKCRDVIAEPVERQTMTGEQGLHILNLVRLRLVIG